MIPQILEPFNRKGRTMAQKLSQTQTPKPQPFAYSVKTGVVSRIVQVNPVFAKHSILTRHVFTSSQLAEMGAQS